MGCYPPWDYRWGTWEYEPWAKWSTKILLCLQISQQRDFCPAKEISKCRQLSLLGGFNIFPPQTMALPEVSSGGTSAARLPELCASENLLFQKEEKAFSKSSSSDTPLDADSRTKAYSWQWSVVCSTGLQQIAISFSKQGTPKGCCLERMSWLLKNLKVTWRGISHFQLLISKILFYFILITEKFILISFFNLNFLVFICRWISSNLISVKEKTL